VGVDHRRKRRMLVKTSIFWLVSAMDTTLPLLLCEVRDCVRSFLVGFTAGHGISNLQVFWPAKEADSKMGAE
jgi:hypothetical protein